MILDDLNQDIKSAMKARDAQKLETLRYLLSEIRNAQIDAKTDIDNDAVIKILRTELKRRLDAQKQFIDANRQDLADSEIDGIKIIESYLPKLMEETEIIPIIEKVVEEMDTPDFGKTMGKAMALLDGKADGAMVAKIIKQKINNRS